MYFLGTKVRSDKGYSKYPINCPDCKTFLRDKDCKRRHCKKNKCDMNIVVQTNVDDEMKKMMYKIADIHLSRIENVVAEIKLGNHDDISWDEFCKL